MNLQSNGTLVKSLQRPPSLLLCLYNMDLSTVAQIAAVTSSGIFTGPTNFARSNALASDFGFENRFHMVSLLRSDSDDHIRS